jgi:acyl-CoA thioesterase-1
MARGWESKSVEDQQAERDRHEPAAPAVHEDPARAAQRRTLELARARAQADLKNARHPAHREMLETAIRAIDEQLSRLLFVVFALVMLGACSLRTVSCSAPQNPAPGEAPAPAAASGGGTTAAPPRFKIAFLGDSLTAGYGLLSDQAFPQLVQQKFADEGYSLVECVNAGVSGDTSAGGRRRVDDVIEPDTRVLVIALGGNDALRGLTTAQTHDNIAAIIDAAEAKGVGVVLAGMEAPTNLGQDYQTAFHQVFMQLGSAYKRQIAFVPFLLEGVAGNPALNQADGIHPNEKGAEIIAEMLYPRLRTIVDQMGGGG